MLPAAALARFYSRFRVSERVLLTGHSHQAWPDAGYEAQKQAWLDAADLVDRKWGRAFAMAERVREGFRLCLTDPAADLALGLNTHELVTRFLSALPLGDRPRLVTTDGEFATVRRQLARLEEEGIEVVRVSAGDPDGLGQGLASAVDDKTAAVVVSVVLFETGRIAGGLDRAAAACRLHGAELLVDAYHALNAVPFSIPELGLEDAFVVGGGYKYCQLGEGVCFLRVPPGCRLRPVLTGWFAEFGTVAAEFAGRSEAASRPGAASGKRAEYPAEVVYGAAGQDRFAGATYDPVSHYRGAAVFGFFGQQGMTPDALRRRSLAQIGRLTEGVDDLDLDPSFLDRDRSAPLESFGGFMVLRAPRAGRLCEALSARGIYSDYRGRMLRLGPAPYVTDSQLDEAIDALREAAVECGAEERGTV